jgi:hypothetical protein
LNQLFSKRVAPTFVQKNVGSNNFLEHFHQHFHGKCCLTFFENVSTPTGIFTSGGQAVGDSSSATLSHHGTTKRGHPSRSGV